jgi:hypothetical protein
MRTEVHEFGQKDAHSFFSGMATGRFAEKTR